MRNICVIGTGYVGLVNGTCLSDFGNRVICVDVDENKIELLNRGNIPIYEPGLRELVGNNVVRGRLRFSSDVTEGIRSSEVIFIAVGTPSKDDGEIDLSHVEDVAREVGENLNSYKVVVNKSTVVVGTGRKVAELIRRHRKTEYEFDVVSNPEFLREGSAIGDFMRPDRVVIGAESERAREIMAEIYRPLYLIETPIINTDIATAEMIKYASNAFLSVKISFINEFANLCDATGADVHDVAKAMGLDGRISPKFLHPGPGFGGSCFPKDTNAINQLAKSNGVEFGIVGAAIEANKRQRKVIVNKIKSLLPDISGKRIAVLGLSFKPNTDDVRESPALDVIRLLMKEGAEIFAYDPVATENARAELGESVNYFGDADGACEGADMLLLMTEWNELRQLDFERTKQLMNLPNVVDCKNIYEPEKMKALGMNYLSIGRPDRKK